MIKKTYKTITPISTIAGDGKDPPPIQSMQCILSNNTQYNVKLTNKELSKGNWGTEPPSEVQAHKVKSFNTWCNPLQDIVGSVTYSIPSATFTFSWSFLAGKIDKLDFQKTDPQDLYTIFFDAEELRFFIDVNEK